MTLTDEEYKEFLEVHLKLLFYVAKQEHIIKPMTPYEIFLKLNLTVKFECRQALIKNYALLDDYITSHFDLLTTEQINILSGFKRKISASFILFKCLKNYAVFIHPEENIKIYAVKALGDPFDDFFDYFPVLVTTTLLPFKDKIVYDGFIQLGNIYFGPEMTWGMNESYKEAKKLKRIITTI